MISKLAQNINTHIDMLAWVRVKCHDLKQDAFIVVVYVFVWRLSRAN